MNTDIRTTAFVMLLLVGLGSAATAQEAANHAVPGAGQRGTQGAVKAELSRAVDRYLEVYAKDFSVELVSSEIKAQASAMASRALSLPVSVDRMLLVSQAGKASLQVSLGGVPANFKPMADMTATRAIEKSPFGRAAARFFSWGFMKAASRMLLAKEDVAVVRDTKALLDVEFNNVDEPFFGNTMIRNMRLILDRKNDTISVVKMTLDKQKTILVKWKYRTMKAQGLNKKFQLPVHMQCKNQANIGFTGDFSMTYTNYLFRAQEEHQDKDVGR